MCTETISAFIYPLPPLLSLLVMGNRGFQGFGDKSWGLCPCLDCFNIHWQKSKNLRWQRKSEEFSGPPSIRQMHTQAHSSAEHFSGAVLTIVSYGNVGWIMHGSAPYERLKLVEQPTGLASCVDFINVKTITWGQKQIQSLTFRLQQHRNKSNKTIVQVISIFPAISCGKSGKCCCISKWILIQKLQSNNPVMNMQKAQKHHSRLFFLTFETVYVKSLLSCQFAPEIITFNVCINSSIILLIFPLLLSERIQLSVFRRLTEADGGAETKWSIYSCLCYLI